MTDDIEDHLTIGAGYVAGQLVQSLRAASGHVDPALRARAEARSRSFLAVLENLVSGALRVGRRQPYGDTPVWVTPEVVRGGFASGQHAAGGPLRPHESALAERLGAWPTRERTALNGHHLTKEGQRELAASLRDRAYRIDVPEEGALLAVRWLIERGEHASAALLLETLEPFFDRLRFYPRAASPQPVPVVGLDAPVLARSAHSLAEGLRKKTPSRDVEAMREAYEVWAPLTDALAVLVLETVDGEPPRFEGEGPARRVVGGTPFARIPEGFDARRGALLARIAAARASHTRCKRIHRSSEVLGTLHAALEAWPRLDEAERASTARRVRHRLAGFVTAYGVPGSERHRALRASQVTGASHALLAQLLAERLTDVVEPGEGLSAEQARAVLAPVTAEEASGDVPVDTPLPAHLTARVHHVEEAPLSTLVSRGLVRSGEVLATLLPQLTAPALATRFGDPAARTLYAATYRAFRQRRSLLLLWLQHQVRFSELPWVAALEATSDADPRPALEETLRQLAAFAISTFPGTITPNKLVSELTVLARAARPPEVASQTGTLDAGTLDTGTLDAGTLHTGTLDTGTLQSGSPATREGAEPRPWLPLVEEVAADIFMGTFSVKFLRAAQVAARLLGSRSLYARYYGLDYERVLSIQDVEPRWGVRTAPDFDAYCLELAALPPGGNPRARSGAMIEQASILTTHNLAVLVDGLALDPLLSDRWSELAERSLGSALDRLERRVLRESVPHIQRMRASKTLAFGWRQMLFYLSRLAPDALAAFVIKADDALAARSPLARERFAPVMAGLHVVASGETLSPGMGGPRRLLGWSVERPFLLGPR